jgi:hypothetical protein
MEPTTTATATDQNKWWRAACGETAGKLLDLAGLPAKQAHDLACRAAAPPPPKPAPKPLLARDTIDGVVRQGRHVMPAAPHSRLAEVGERGILKPLEALHLLDSVLEAMGVGVPTLSAAAIYTGPAMLVKFIGEIARANAEGKVDAARAAVAYGFATVMAEVLDRGHLRPSTLASLRERARAMRPELGSRLSLGVEAAAKALDGLTPAERNRVRDELLARTPHLQVSGCPERQLRVKTQGLLLGAKPARY